MDEIVVNASLDPKALEVLSAKFERLSAIVSEANALLRELASSELKLTLETDTQRHAVSEKAGVDENAHRRSYWSAS